MACNVANFLKYFLRDKRNKLCFVRVEMLCDLKSCEIPDCCDDVESCGCAKARTFFCTWEFGIKRPRSIHGKRIASTSEDHATILKKFCNAKVCWYSKIVDTGNA